MANATVTRAPSYGELDANVPIHLALPKGHMQEGVFRLFEDAGMKVRGGLGGAPYPQ